QSQQRVLQLLALRRLARAVQPETLPQLEGVRAQRGQGVQRLAPARQVAMAAGQLGGELLGQLGRPGGQRGAGQVPGQGGKVDHGRAISEAKLRHWNQGTTRVKPASSRRWRCCSRLSGCMTCSMALRFWAISSSLY